MPELYSPIPSKHQGFSDQPSMSSTQNTTIFCKISTSKEHPTTRWIRNVPVHCSTSPTGKHRPFPANPSPNIDKAFKSLVVFPTSSRTSLAREKSAYLSLSSAEKAKAAQNTKKKCSFWDSIPRPKSLGARIVVPMREQIGAGTSLTTHKSRDRVT